MLTQVGAPIQVTRWFLSRASCDACQHKTDWLWLADHYAGLSETWDNGVIYCSEQTARLIQHMDQLRIKKDLVRPLPMDTPVTIDGDSLTSDCKFLPFLYATAPAAAAGQS